MALRVFDKVGITFAPGTPQEVRDKALRPTVPPPCPEGETLVGLTRSVPPHPICAPVDTAPLAQEPVTTTSISPSEPLSLIPPPSVTSPGETIREVWRVEWLNDPPTVSDIGQAILGQGGNIDLHSVQYLSQNMVTKTGELEIVYSERVVQQTGLIIGTVVIATALSTVFFFAERFMRSVTPQVESVVKTTGNIALYIFLAGVGLWITSRGR